MSDFTEPISVVEDLDPEPPPKQGITQRLELIVGVLLLVAVLSFVSWQWWHTQAQTNAYDAGETALTTNDWDAALANFTQAGDYKDAAKLAKNAQAQVDERNEFYLSAQQNITDTKWLAALTDVRAAAKIEPGYKNLALWEELTRQSVYSDALSGTVAMRPNARPPGLYMRNARTWVYLHGSDSQSRLEARPRDGQLIFDAVDASGKRRLVSAVLIGDEFEYTPLSFSPDLVVQCVSTPDGVWVTENAQAYAVSPNQEEPVIRSSYTGFKVTYEPYSSPITYTVAPPPTFTYTTGNDVVLAFGAKGEYLIAYYSGAATSGVMTRTNVNVYLATAGSATRQLIYTQAGGGIQSALISPDGRYAIITAFRLMQNSTEEQSVILIDLKHLTSTYNIRTTNSPDGPTGPARDLLNSIFVQSGAYAGDILISQYKGDTTEFTLIDPGQVSANLLAVEAHATMPDPRSKLWLLTSQNADGIILAGRDESISTNTITQTLDVVSILKNGPTYAQTIIVPAPEDITSFRTADDKAIWGYNVSAQDGTQNSSSVSAVPINVIPTNYITSTLIFSQSYTLSQSRTSLAPSITLGDNLLAYTQNRQLHVRTYDGTLDLSLETGVTLLYDKSVFHFATDELK